nr:methyltransferase [Flavobacteriaceae bacterium]
LSKEYEEITYEQIDVFSKDFEELEYDIALATLFIHHFKEKEIIHILKLMNDTAKVGVIINDLQRHKLAYYLFKIVSSFLVGNEMVQHDGLLSILRGFKRKELEVIANKLNRKNTIRWKWAFRYQWIFKN